MAESAFALFDIWYNFARVDTALKATPTVQHGIAAEPWTLERLLVELVAVDQLHKKGSCMVTLVADIEHDGETIVSDATVQLTLGARGQIVSGVMQIQEEVLATLGVEMCELVAKDGRRSRIMIEECTNDSQGNMRLTFTGDGGFTR